MEIYLMQHGLALKEEEDPEESLSPDGRKGIETSAKALQRLSVRPDLILHSPKKRSLQTAEILQKALSTKKILETEKVKAMTAAEESVEYLLNHSDVDKILIAGHLPSLSEIASFLLSSNSIELAIRNGGCTRIDTKDLLSKRGTLLWHLTPEQCEMMAK